MEYELVWSPPLEALPEPTAEQRAVLDGWDRPTLVVGGPGTGKTTLAALAAVESCQRGTQPLVVTRTRRAASRLRNAIAVGLGGRAWKPAVTTMHAFCRRVVADAGGGEPSVLTAPEQDFRVRELLAGGSGRWPGELRLAVQTKGFARLVRECLARTRQLGLDPSDLARFGRAAGQPEWVCLGEFFGEYLDVLDAEGVLDYAELVHRARIALSRPATAERWRREFGALVVDEYLELDAGQLGVLAQVRGGLPLLALGDPAGVLSAFRGSFERAVQVFPDIFGPGASVVALERGLRHGGELAAALNRLRGRMPVPVVNGCPFAGSPSPADKPGSLRALVCADELAQARAVVGLVRERRLAGRAWEEIAVLTRTKQPILLRALLRADVPARVEGAQEPLAESRAVGWLLDGLRLALGPDEAVEASLAAQGLLEAALQAARLVASGESAVASAWHLWSRSGLADRLKRAYDDGSASAAKELAAVREFFSVAADGELRTGVAGVRELLELVEAQQLPVDHEREAGSGGAAVEVLTVHQAKGRQWPCVVVVGADEGVWPRALAAPSLLDARALGSDGLGVVADHSVAEDRRAFYAACACACEELVVVCGERPSRFVGELGVDVQPWRPAQSSWTLPELTGELRRLACDPGEAPTLREAAATTLALVPGGDPERWWGLREVSEAQAGEAGRVTLSPSQLGALLECPRRYFLNRCGGSPDAGPAAEFGTLVHDLVRRLQTDSPPPAELDELLEAGIADISYPSPWEAAAALEEGRRALRRAADWLGGREAVEQVGVEVPFRVAW
ncbi:MAG: ATP-dependent helicase, partial [Propionibacteriaceae bacterium]|nr:ATP-dependent helicase [Propionibacteriaceae bacterium]